MIGTLNTELGKLKIELEQEKAKCANTKEKLNMPCRRSLVFWGDCRRSLVL